MLVTNGGHNARRFDWVFQNDNVKIKNENGREEEYPLDEIYNVIKWLENNYDHGLHLSTHYEVKGYGKVKVPAGEFDAYYILGRSDYGARINELWYSPAVKNYIKGVLYTNNGKIIEELSSFRVEQEKQ